MPVMSSLFNDTVFHDVTLACNDGRMKSARALLALAYSPLMEVLKNREDETLVLIMPDFSQSEIRKLFDILLVNKIVATDGDGNIDDSRDNVMDSEEKMKSFKIMGIDFKEENPIGFEEQLNGGDLEMNDIGIKESCEIIRSSNKITKEESLDIKEMETMPNQICRSKNTSILYESFKRDNDHSKDKFRSKDVKRFSCTFCNYQVNPKSSFDQHIKRKHGEKEEALVCTRRWCEKTFSTKHEREEHNKSCFLTCGVCGKKFHRQDHLNGHMRAEAKKALKDAAQNKWQRYAT